jgi:thioredoxin-like negative regulator of GroEL
LSVAVVSIELACAGGTSTDGQTIDSLTAKLVAEPNDHASRHALALKFFGAGEVESALTSALELFKRDRNWNDGAGMSHFVMCCFV